MTEARADKQTPATSWPHQRRVVPIRDSEIAYTDEGTGPALLLVHDGMCSYLWIHLIERLRDRYRVVTLDFPGSGLSSASGNPVSLESDSALLGSFVDSLGLENYTLVAHDLGGGVGLGLATGQPERVDGLVLINTFAWPADTFGLRTMLRIMGSRPVSSVNSGTNFLVVASSGRFGVGRHFDADQRAAYRSMFANKGARRRIHDLMASAVKEGEYLASVESGLVRLKGCPVLTIFGARNDPFQFQRRWLTHFPEADQMVVPGGYHFPMCDDPDGVSQRIAAWHDTQIGRT